MTFGCGVRSRECGVGDRAASPVFDSALRPVRAPAAGCCDGFRSRCRMPCSWACWTARAMTATSRAASRGGSGPSAATRWASVAPSDVLHAEVRLPVDRADLVDGDDVRVLEPGGGLGLGAEPGAVGVGWPGALRGSSSGRRRGRATLLPGLVDDAHAAAAEFLEQLEVAELARQARPASAVAAGGCGPAAWSGGGGAARGRGRRTGRRPTGRGVRRRGRGGRRRRRPRRRRARPAARRRGRSIRAASRSSRSAGCMGVVYARRAQRSFADRDRGFAVRSSNVGRIGSSRRPPRRRPPAARRGTPPSPAGPRRCGS